MIYTTAFWPGKCFFARPASLSALVAGWPGGTCLPSCPWCDAFGAWMQPGRKHEPFGPLPRRVALARSHGSEQPLRHAHVRLKHRLTMMRQRGRDKEAETVSQRQNRERRLFIGIAARVGHDPQIILAEKRITQSGHTDGGPHPSTGFLADWSNPIRLTKDRSSLRALFQIVS